MRQNERGDAILILTIGTLVVLGVSSLVSLILPKTNQSTKTKAADRSERYCNLHRNEAECKPTCTRCDGKACNYHPELEPWCQDAGKDLGGCLSNDECGGSNPPPPNCPGKLDIAGVCNTACCDPNIPNSFTGQNCVVPNGYCKTGFSQAPSKKIKRACSSNTCAWTYCADGDPNCCNAADIGDASKLTDSDVKSCSSCFTNDECVGTTKIPNDQSSNTCFNLTTQIYADKEAEGYRFNTHLRVGSPPGGKDGHIQLFVNGGSKSWMKGWNKNVNNPFDIEPQYTDSPFVSNGSKTMNYAVKIDECNERGNYLNITCEMLVVNGVPSVNGPGCACVNCNTYTSTVKTPPPASNPPTSNSGPIDQAACRRCKKEKQLDPTFNCDAECGTTATGDNYCISSKGDRVRRDKLAHCLPSIDSKTYGMCNGTDAKATEQKCPNSDCRPYGNIDGTSDGCFPPAGTATTCKTSDGKTINRDGVNHCLDDGITSAICEDGKDKATETSCPVKCYPDGSADGKSASCNPPATTTKCVANGELIDRDKASHCLADGKKIAICVDGQDNAKIDTCADKCDSKGSTTDKQSAACVPSTNTLALPANKCVDLAAPLPGETNWSRPGDTQHNCGEVYRGDCNSGKGYYFAKILCGDQKTYQTQNGSVTVNICTYMLQSQAYFGTDTFTVPWGDGTSKDSGRICTPTGTTGQLHITGIIQPFRCATGQLKIKKVYYSASQFEGAGIHTSEKAIAVFNPPSEKADINSYIPFLQDYPRGDLAIAVGIELEDKGNSKFIVRNKSMNNFKDDSFDISLQYDCSQ